MLTIFRGVLFISPPRFGLIQRFALHRSIQPSVLVRLHDARVREATLEAAEYDALRIHEPAHLRWRNLPRRVQNTLLAARAFAPLPGRSTVPGVTIESADTP